MKVIIRLCLCVVMVESFLNGVGQLAADHSTTTLRIIIVATVELFLDLMDLPVVVRMSIRQVLTFVAMVELLLGLMDLLAVVVHMSIS